MSVSTAVLSNVVRNSLFKLHNRSLAPTLLNANHSSQSSVDPESVKHLEKMASVWWNELGSMKPLHSMNSLRVPFIRDGLFSAGAANHNRKNTAKPLDGLRIVDVGCGGGLLSEPLARLGATVTGIDASLELIDVAKQHAESDLSLRGRLQYIHTLAETLAIEDEEKYDAVVSSEVIEHVQNKTYFIEQCVKLLKPKGSIFLTTVSRTTQSWLAGIIGAEDVLKIVPQGTHQWELFISPPELQAMLEQYGPH